MNLLQSFNKNLAPLKYSQFLFVKNYIDFVDDTNLIKYEYDWTITSSKMCVNLIYKYVYYKMFNHVKGVFRDTRKGEIEHCTLDSVDDYIISRPYNEHVSFFINHQEKWTIKKNEFPGFLFLWSDGMLNILKRDKKSAIGIRAEYYDSISLDKIWSFPFDVLFKSDVSSQTLHNSTLIFGLRNNLKVALDRKSGEKIWEVQGTYSHNMHECVYENSFFNIYGLHFVEIDILTGHVKRDLVINHLKNDGLARIGPFRIYEGKIFFIDNRKIGVLDLDTLDLVGLTEVVDATNDKIEFLNKIEVHNNKIYVVGVTQSANSVTQIYTYL